MFVPTLFIVISVTSAVPLFANTHFKRFKDLKNFGINNGYFDAISNQNQFNHEMQKTGTVFNDFQPHSAKNIFTARDGDNFVVNMPLTPQHHHGDNHFQRFNDLEDNFECNFYDKSRSWQQYDHGMWNMRPLLNNFQLNSINSGIFDKDERDFRENIPNFYPLPYFSAHQYDTFNDFDEEFMNDFWKQFNNDMREMNTMIDNFRQESKVPTFTELVDVVENNYVVKIPLLGFDENDIVVKASKTVLKVFAVHKSDDGSEKHYTEVHMIPSNINIDVTGNWGYDNELITIIFPLIRTEIEDSSELEKEDSTKSVYTTEHWSREEIEEWDRHGDEDADVGVTSKVDDGIRTIEDPLELLEDRTKDPNDQWEFVKI